MQLQETLLRAVEKHLIAVNSDTSPGPAEPPLSKYSKLPKEAKGSLVHLPHIHAPGAIMVTK